MLVIAQTADLEERIALLEAGADDVIAKPFDARSSLARIDALAVRSQLVGPAGSIGDEGRHRLVTVFSPKGGVGTTTIATNLALLAAEAHPDQVLLIDLDLSFGQVASHLNLQPKQTLLELVRDEAALHEVELFRRYAIHHAERPARPRRAAHARRSPRWSPRSTSSCSSPGARGVRHRHRRRRLGARRPADRSSAADTVVVPVCPRSPPSTRCTSCSTT